MTSIVVLNTQMYNIKFKSSILSIKSDAQKQMIEYGFGRSFMTLTILKLDFFLNIL